MSDIYDNWLETVCEKIEKKMEVVSERSKNKIPYTTIDGVHDNKNIDNISWWTNGFWGGMLWMLYKQTGKDQYKDIANISENMLDRAIDEFYGLHHDVGFTWRFTSVANYQLTGNEKSKKRALMAANLLAGRFNPVGEYIRAWNDFGNSMNTSGWAIIDSMMNISILYWASEETKDPRFKEIAMKHADTAMKAFVRPDGSVNHIVEFDPIEGGVIQTHGGQGFEVGSSWSRGQAWGLYGFVISYIHTGKQEYLDIAKRIAHYFIANICDDYSVKVDFRAPKEPYYIDNTAGAIAACGLIELSKQVGQYEKDLYKNPAIKLLRVIEEKYIDWSDKTDNLLTMCTAAYHDKNHHFSIIYGDSFFMEACYKLRGYDIFMW
jgi:unsaturated chondroitin disaccharide hydrolase